MRNVLNKIQECKIELKGGLAIGTIMLWASAIIGVTLDIASLVLKVLIFIMKHIA